MAHVTEVEAATLDDSPVAARRRWAARISAVFARLVEIPAALLVVAEVVVVLLAGILARYVLHKPIVWSDELAGILFLWLAMLGSVIALQRGEHMRMTAVVGMLKPRARAFLDVVAAALAFLLLVLHPAYEFAADEVYVTTPALEIANSWRAAALPVGIGLISPLTKCLFSQDDGPSACSRRSELGWRYGRGERSEWPRQRRHRGSGAGQENTSRSPRLPSGFRPRSTGA